MASFVPQLFTPFNTLSVLSSHLLPQVVLCINHQPPIAGQQFVWMVGTISQA